jgi:hypothetical protein
MQFLSFSVERLQISLPSETIITKVDFDDATITIKQGNQSVTLSYYSLAGIRDAFALYAGPDEER